AVGYALRHAGAAVTFVEADLDKVRWGQEHGVQIAGHPPLAAAFVAFDEWFPPKDEIVLLFTKSYNNAAVLPRIPASPTLIPIQNGFARTLANQPGPEGIASFISECEPGKTVTRLTRKGHLHLGMRCPSPSAKRGAESTLAWRSGSDIIEDLTKSFQ